MPAGALPLAFGFPLSSEITTSGERRVGALFGVPLAARFQMR
jgi:hypothetical protein